MSKHTKHHSLLCELENFPTTPRKFSVTYDVKVDKNYPRKYAGYAVSCCFTLVPEILGLVDSPKMGYRRVYCYYILMY